MTWESESEKRTLSQIPGILSFASGIGIIYFDMRLK